MFDNNLFLLSVLISVCLFSKGASVVDENAENSNTVHPRFRSDVNDSILELYHDCLCIPYYNCPEVNKIMSMAKSRSVLSCSDPNYLCCKTNITEVGIETTTIPSVKVELKKPNIDENACGMARSTANVRILDSDTDSAITMPGEMPWMVEIFRKANLKRPYEFKCTGTLIHPKVVLTATHCVVSSKKESLKIIANSQGIFLNVSAKPENERKVYKIIKHENYYSGGLFNDIALLILEKRYSFSGSFNSICLPNSNEKDFNNKRCLVIGWGNNGKLASRQLMKVDVPVIEFQRCQNLLRETSLGFSFNLHSSFMCAGGEKGKDSCNGDGGGPLICLGEGYRYIQVGIVSWGVNNECGVENQPGVYTNVSNARNWIINELSKYQITVK